VDIPEGFAAVHAKGLVSHDLLELRWPNEPRIVDLSTGEERRAPVTQEVWWDHGSGLYRVIDRVDGQVTFDLVGNRCFPAPNERLCTPTPYDPELQTFRWPLDPKSVRAVGRRTFRGRELIWAQMLVNGRLPKGGADLVGLDAQTHQPVVHRQFFRGRLIQETVITSRPQLPASDVSFVVPEGGPPRPSYPPLLPAFTDARGTGLQAVRHGFGRAPVWLGPSFRGHPLRSARVGTFGARLATGRKVDPVPFARFDYGIVSVQVFDCHPFWWKEGPPAGQMVLDGRGLLVRDGFFIVLTGNSKYAIDRAHALALADALESLPVG
jgi:hypothetical protein